MTRNLHLPVALLIFLAPSAEAEPIILCGDDTVFVVDTAQDKIEKAWNWKAKQCAQLPEAMRSTFATTEQERDRALTAERPANTACRVLARSNETSRRGALGGSLESGGFSRFGSGVA